MNYCPYCPTGEHSFVCNCGHTHAQHRFRGSCSVLECACRGYSQTAQRTEEEKQVIKMEPGTIQ